MEGEAVAAERVEAAETVNGGPVVAEAAEAAVKQPGEVTHAELVTLYSAAEIKVRAQTEQLEARDQALMQWNALGTRLMEMLGVEDLDAILPRVEELTKNRQARRSHRASRQSKKEG